MITPNIAPRKITGSAAAGLFSAAKSSVRRMEKTTDAISKAPDITKEQKFGINYVQFFGSKKNSKILKKSLKSIRDSLVATFEIAKLLRSEVSKNVKLIGEKTKKNKGFFGLGLGGLLSLASLLANPVVLSVLGIGAGVAGVGFLTQFLIDNRDKIAEFIMNKATGLYNTLQGLVTNIVRGFLGDRFKDPETRNVEIESENRIEETMDKLIKEGGITKGDARIEATGIEMDRITQEIETLEGKGAGRTSADDDRLEALNKRLTQLQTGKSVFDREIDNPIVNMMRNFFEKEVQREAVFLPENQKYSELSQEKKLEKIKGLVGNFRSKGNSMDRIKEIYGRALMNEASMENDPEKFLQAKDIIEYARRDDKVTRKTEKGIDSSNFNFAEFGDPRQVTFNPSQNNNTVKNGKDSSGGTEEGGTGGVGGGDNVQGQQSSNLNQVPVEASSSPTCRYYSNFDADNDLPGYNRSLLCID